MGDGASQKPNDLVIIPGNPPPEGAEVIWYEGKGGRKLRMLFAPEPKTNDARTRGTAIVCPGRTEFIEKYFEVARDLQGRGFAVVIFDWPRMPGFSRMSTRRSASLAVMSAPASSIAFLISSKRQSAGTQVLLGSGVISALMTLQSGVMFCLSMRA
jgi:hypothetical protein